MLLQIHNKLRSLEDSRNRKKKKLYHAILAIVFFMLVSAGVITLLLMTETESRCVLKRLAL